MWSPEELDALRKAPRKQLYMKLVDIEIAEDDASPLIASVGKAGRVINNIEHLNLHNRYVHGVYLNRLYDYWFNNIKGQTKYLDKDEPEPKVFF